jgi:hypothetical protein
MFLPSNLMDIFCFTNVEYPAITQHPCSAGTLFDVVATIQMEQAADW